MTFLVWATMGVASDNEELVVLTHADDERRRLARGNEAVGVTLVNHDQSIRAHNFLERGPNGIGQIQAGGELHLFDEVSKHFGVGFADQVVAAVCEQFAKGLVVFDDAIVNDCNASLTSGVRMGVHVARGAMCGPPRVSYAHSALGFVFPQMWASSWPLLPFSFRCAASSWLSNVAMPALS